MTSPTALRPLPSARSIRYEQAVYGSFPFWSRGYDLLARSPGCRPEWLAEFQEACQRFGGPSRGASGAGAMFALRLPSGPWAVVGVTPQGTDDRGRPGALAFHGLLIAPREFSKGGFDPFTLTGALRSDWGPATSLAASDWPVSPPAGEADEPDGEAVRIAGALARGHRVAIESSEPIDRLARGVWRALPTQVRRRATVATLAFGNANRFSLLAVPCLAGIELDPSYLTPDAIEPPAPTAPRARLGRRRAAALAVVVAAVLAGLAGWVLGPSPHDDPVPRPEIDGRPVLPVEPVARRAAIDQGYPDRSSYREADEGERARVSEALGELAGRFGIVPDGSGAGADPSATMIALADRLRYRGPWLSPSERALLRAEPGPGRSRALAWHEHLLRFAPDRPLPPAFASGPLRWQLDALGWSFGLAPDPSLASEDVPRALGDYLAVEGPVRPSLLADRYPALAGYARFLARLPRR